MKPTIAVIAFGTTAVSPIEEQNESLAQLHSIKERALACLAGLPVTTIDPFEKVITSLADADRAVSELRRKPFDALVFFFASWAQEEVPLSIASEFATSPKLLWGILEPPELNSLAGVLSTGTNFNRVGYRYNYSIGDFDDKVVLQKISRFARAAAVANRLRKAKIAIIGYPPPGMMDVTYGEAELKQLGPSIIHLDIQNLLTRFEELSNTDTEKAVADMVKGVQVDSQLSHQELQNAAKMYLALRNIVSTYQLDAVAARCWPELFERKLPICPAFSKIADEGISTSCEADVSMAVTQMIMNWLSGTPAASMDVGPVNYKDNTLFAFHCGSAATCLAETPQHVRLSRHTLAGRGVEVDMELRMGPVTLAKLAGPVGGKFTMVVSKGDVVKGQFGKAPGVGHYATVRLDSPISEFIDSFLIASAGHHVAIASGDIRDELISMCNILSIEVVSV
jgi:L-fucose isomerase-like protein